MNTNRLATSYILCVVWLFGLAGLQRLYNGKIGTSLLWLLTWVFFCVGQFVDLFMIPTMVEEHDIKLRAKASLSPNGVPLTGSAIALTATSPAYNKLMKKLLTSAHKHGGTISVTQAVMDTGASLAEVEAILKQMVKSGYVMVGNHPKTGAVIYHFLEL